VLCEGNDGGQRLIYAHRLQADGRSLDLSFNNIRHIPSLPSLTKVNVMYLVQNKIGKVDEGALDWAKDTLTSLELGGNRIRVRVDLRLIVRHHVLSCEALTSVFMRLVASTSLCLRADIRQSRTSNN